MANDTSKGGRNSSRRSYGSRCCPPGHAYGCCWQRVLDSWIENLIGDPSDYNCLTAAETPERTCAVLRAYFSRQTAAAAAAK